MLDEMDNEKAVELAQIFKALGDPTRLRMIHLLSRGEKCVHDIAKELKMSQSAISHQLRLLRNLRLVKYRRLGKQAIYSLDDMHVLRLFNEGLEHVNHD